MEKSNFMSAAEQMKEKLGEGLCLAKWQQVSLHLPTGLTNSCYHPPLHEIDATLLKNNPSALHNTPHKKEQRRIMLRNERPAECQYCWNMEDLGQLSDRHYRSGEPWAAVDFERIRNSTGDEDDVIPSYVEVNFNHACNLQCSYCSPQFSSSWMDEVTRHGAYPTSNPHNDPAHFVGSRRPIPVREANPYVDAFWEWWPELRKTLNIMRVTGGEPTLHKSTWTLLDKIDEDPMPWLELNINSNLGTKNILIERLATKVRKLYDEKKIRTFKLFTSMDTWGERAEYIRTGLELELWEKNFHTYLTLSGAPITFMITFNIFSVTTFKSLLEKFLEWRKQYGWYEGRKEHMIRFDTPYLRDPIQYDMNILPKEEFMPYMYESLKFMEDNLDDNRADAFSTIEYEKFKRVVDYMAETVYSEEKLVEGRRDFYNWFNELDDRRETDMLSVFPEMMDFYRLCQEVNLTNPL